MIYSNVNSVVIKGATAKETDFDNVFVVNFHNWFAEREWVREYGEVLAFEPGRYGVMRLLPEKAEELSARLHQLGFALRCSCKA